jgi:hypothetical protein
MEAGGHRQVASIMGAAGGRGDDAAKRTAMRKEGVMVRARSDRASGASDDSQCMIGPAMGAARPEAPESKEPCQRSEPAC